MAPSRSRTRLIVVTGVLAALLLASCGSDQRTPVEVRLKKETVKETVLGFPALATKNTTRVGGKDAIANAAAVASAVYPGRSPTTRPAAVALVNQSDWRSAIAASVLMSPPLRAPLLYSSKDTVPAPTADAIRALSPRGAADAGGAQVIRVGDAKAPGGVRATSISGRDPYTVSDAIDRFATAAAGQPAPHIVIASDDDQQFAMPAAAWAAKSGDPVLFAHKNALPAQTVNAIKRHQQPSIYVLGPPSVISEGVIGQLRKLGDVRRISGPNPVDNAIAFARYTDGEFGWGVRDPGHGLVFANAADTQDAAAGAALSGAGTYGPLLLVDSATKLPATLENYLLDIQPGYRFDPVRGVYNHAWLMGDESAISVDLQARIDELMEIVRVKKQGGT